MIKYSIIVCSYNRYSLLIETIESIIKALGCRMDCEVLLIDNNSNDNTPQLKDVFLKDKRIKYLLELNQGLSHARNRGIKEASGDVLVFLDDDIALVDNYFGICDKIFKDKSINIIGGKVVPYKVNIPDWLPEKYFHLVSIFDLGNTPLKVKQVMGANYAMRMEVVQKIGWYNPKLGRKGDSLMGGEESEYIHRATRLGFEVYYYPELIVFHKINNKLNKKYVYDHAYLQGKSEFIIEYNSIINRVYLKLIKSIVAIILNKMISVFVYNNKRKTFLKIIEQYGLGYINGWKDRDSSTRQ